MMKRFLEQLGVDWFTVIFKSSDFSDTPSPYPLSIKEISERFGDLSDEQKLDDAVSYCTNLLKREEDRLDKIESKAFTLIGITGIAAGFIVAFAGLLFDWEKISSMPALVIASTLYVIVAMSLMLTIFLAIKVINIGDYHLTYPSANDIFKLSNANLSYVKRERVISLFYSFAHNVQIVNKKATYLGGAQLWFRNSIILLLSTALFFAIYVPVVSYLNNSSGGITTQSAPTPTYTPTASPTGTSTPTDTPTNTPTPTATLQPTFTPVPITSPTLTTTVTVSVTRKSTSP